MSDAEPNEFQIIREESPFPDQYEAEWAQVERFIGKYVIDWNHIEFFLSMGIAAKARGVPNLQRALTTQPARNKIEFLRGILPPTWDEGGRLLAHLEEGNSFRNALAHSSLAMGGFDGTRQRGWHLWNVKGRDARLDIPHEVRTDRLARVAVLKQAVVAIMDDDYMSADIDPNALSLAERVLRAPGGWSTRKDWELFRETALEMFPV